MVSGRRAEEVQELGVVPTRQDLRREHAEGRHYARVLGQLTLAPLPGVGGRHGRVEDANHRQRAEPTLALGKGLRERRAGSADADAELRSGGRCVVRCSTAAGCGSQGLLRVRSRGQLLGMHHAGCAERGGDQREGADSGSAKNFRHDSSPYQGGIPEWARTFRKPDTVATFGRSTQTRGNGASPYPMKATRRWATCPSLEPCLHGSGITTATP